MTPLHYLLLYYKGTNEEADDETNSKSPIIRDNNYYRFMDFGSLNCIESALCHQLCCISCVIVLQSELIKE